MRLSETITIYLAIGAPFGVNYFLRVQRGQERSLRSLFKAAGAGLLWPLVAVAALVSRRSAKTPAPTAAGSNDKLNEQLGEKIAAARQQLFAALERVRELAQHVCGAGEDLEQKVRLAREGIERYVGLTLALAEASMDDPPASREMELCRVAGRTGDDLLLAGRCIHRRNVARLIARQANSRTELLHALATVRELHDDGPAATSSAITAARRWSVAVLKFYGQAINLLSLLEDESAARSAAQLLDAECARLRKLEAQCSEAVATFALHDSSSPRHTRWYD